MIARLQTWAAVIGFFVVALAASWFGGRNAGAADTKAKATEDKLKAARAAQGIENEVEALDRDDLKRRATVWVRGTKR